MNRCRWIGTAGAGMLVIAWLAAPAAAAPVERGWSLRFSVASIDFDSNLASRSGYGIDLGAAVGVNGEYRLNRRLGLDLGAFAGGGVDVAGRRSWIGWANYDVYDTMSLSGLTAGLDIHLTPDGRVDVYVCPLVAWMQYGSLVFEAAPDRVATAVDFDGDFAVGAGLGVGVPFGAQRSWSFNAQVTHLESTLNGSDRGDLSIQEDYDATMVGLGFGYRF